MGDSSVHAQRDNQSKSQCLYGWQVTSCDAGGKIQSRIHMGLREVYSKPDMTGHDVSLHLTNGHV